MFSYANLNCQLQQNLIIIIIKTILIQSDNEACGSIGASALD